MMDNTIYTIRSNDNYSLTSKRNRANANSRSLSNRSSYYSIIHQKYNIILLLLALFVTTTPIDDIIRQKQQMKPGIFVVYSLPAFRIFQQLNQRFLPQKQNHEFVSTFQRYPNDNEITTQYGTRTNGQYDSILITGTTSTSTTTTTMTMNPYGLNRIVRLLRGGADNNDDDDNNTIRGTKKIIKTAKKIKKKKKKITTKHVKKIIPNDEKKNPVLLENRSTNKKKKKKKKVVKRRPGDMEDNLPTTISTNKTPVYRKQGHKVKIPLQQQKQHQPNRQQQLKSEPLQRQDKDISATPGTKSKVIKKKKKKVTKKGKKVLKSEQHKESRSFESDDTTARTTIATAKLISNQVPKKRKQLDPTTGRQTSFVGRPVHDENRLDNSPRIQGDDTKHDTRRLEPPKRALNSPNESRDDTKQYSNLERQKHQRAWGVPPQQTTKKRMYSNKRDFDPTNNVIISNRAKPKNERDDESISAQDDGPTKKTNEKKIKSIKKKRKKKKTLVTDATITYRVASNEPIQIRTMDPAPSSLSVSESQQETTALATSLLVPKSVSPDKNEVETSPDFQSPDNRETNENNNVVEPIDDEIDKEMLETITDKGEQTSISDKPFKIQAKQGALESNEADESLKDKSKSDLVKKRKITKKLKKKKKLKKINTKIEDASEAKIIKKQGKKIKKKKNFTKKVIRKPPVEADDVTEWSVSKGTTTPDSAKTPEVIPPTRLQEPQEDVLSNEPIPDKVSKELINPPVTKSKTKTKKKIKAKSRKKVKKQIKAQASISDDIQIDTTSQQLTEVEELRQNETGATTISQLDSYQVQKESRTVQTTDTLPKANVNLPHGEGLNDFPNTEIAVSSSESTDTTFDIPTSQVPFASTSTASDISESTEIIEDGEHVIEVSTEKNKSVTGVSDTNVEGTLLEEEAKDEAIADPRSTIVDTGVENSTSMSTKLELETESREAESIDQEPGILDEVQQKRTDENDLIDSISTGTSLKVGTELREEDVREEDCSIQYTKGEANDDGAETDDATQNIEDASQAIDQDDLSISKVPETLPADIVPQDNEIITCEQEIDWSESSSSSSDDRFKVKQEDSESPTSSDSKDEEQLHEDGINAAETPADEDKSSVSEETIPSPAHDDPKDQSEIQKDDGNATEKESKYTIDSDDDTDSDSDNDSDSDSDSDSESESSDDDESDDDDDDDSLSDDDEVEDVVGDGETVKYNDIKNNSDFDIVKDVQNGGQVNQTYEETLIFQAISNLENPGSQISEDDMKKTENQFDDIEKNDESINTLDKDDAKAALDDVDVNENNKGQPKTSADTTSSFGKEESDDADDDVIGQETTHSETNHIGDSLSDDNATPESRARDNTPGTVPTVDEKDIPAESNANSAFTEDQFALDNLYVASTDSAATARVTAASQESQRTASTTDVLENHEPLNDDDETDVIVSLVTWNLAEESPSEVDASFIRRFRPSKTTHHRVGNKPITKKGRSGSDIVLISAQECENIKPRRTEGRRSKEYRRLMIKMLGKEYVPLAIHLLGGIQFGLFCKRAVLDDIEHVSISDVTCGIGNVFHNKGGIGAFVQMKARQKVGKDDGTIDTGRAKSIRMLFVTAHMAAHVGNSAARDSDFWRIIGELEGQAPERFIEQAGQNNKAAGTQLLESIDHIFFCGDLNYRLDLPRETVEFSVSRMNQLREVIEAKKSRTKKSDVDLVTKAKIDFNKIRQQLLRHDQLKASIAEGRAFPGFTEGAITFQPTFKYDKQTDNYDTSGKHRVPAWTDRVLFRSTGARVLEYTSVQNCQHSDHRPVYATFRVRSIGRKEQRPKRVVRKSTDEQQRKTATAVRKQTKKVTPKTVTSTKKSTQTKRKKRVTKVEQ